MLDDVRPEEISVIASILARGYLRHRKSQRFSLPDRREIRVDFEAEQSRHVTVVNAFEEKED